MSGFLVDLHKSRLSRRKVLFRLMAALALNSGGVGEAGRRGQLMAESGNGNGKPKTELLDELEKGPWPSFVKEIKAASQATMPATTCSGNSNFPTRKERDTGSTAALLACWATAVE